MATADLGNDGWRGVSCGNEPVRGGFLPIYDVVRTGIEEGHARQLGRALRISDEALFWREGLAAFIDPDHFLAVPSTAVDPAAGEALRRATTNHHPDTPIEVRAIDFAALARIKPPGREEALRLAAAALDSAGVAPEHATPVVGHTVFMTVSTAGEGGPTRTITTNLDTQVSYRCTLDGYLLAGPGAQVHVSFGDGGRVTRLFHSMRALQPGSLVEIIPAAEVRARFTRYLTEEAEVETRLVYWAPPLRTGIHCESQWRAASIIPWYAVKIRRRVIDPKSKAVRTRTSRVHLVPATEDPRYVPAVTLVAATTERSHVAAHATATGGTPPYIYLWAGSNPETARATGDTVRYVPRVRDFRRVQRAQSLERTEQVSVTVIDANGVRAVASQSLRVTAQAAPGTHNSVTYGCESPNDPGPSPTDGSYAPERIAWQQAMGAPNQGGGSQRFCWLADDSWPGDYIEPNPPGSLEPSPWINGDADYSNWGINTTNIMLYNGDGWAEGFAEMYPGATVADYNTGSGAGLSAPGTSGDVSIGSQSYTVNYSGSWGAPYPNDNLQWLAMYACQILENDASYPAPWDRWGPAFNGLHSLLGFETEASDAGIGFMADFPANILGYTSFSIFGDTLYLPVPPTTIVQGWLNAAITNNMGTPAAMGPINGAICDYWDYYWGKGPVGPNIPQPQITGWWYIQGTGPMQDFP